MYDVFRQVGHSVGRKLADRQYEAARIQPNATLAEHLEQFENLWNWTANQWQGELSDLEQDKFSKLGTETEEDVFRILKNFARYAAEKRESDFPFPIQHVALRLGVSFQYVSQLRQHFVKLSIIAETKRAVTNRSAARFKWCLQVDQTPTHTP